MLLFVLMAVLTAAAALAVLVPLGRPTAGAAANDRAAGSIYRDQLDELARDRERGLIGDGEAEAARVEVARRILKAEDTAGSAAASPAIPRAAIAFACVAIPLVALGTYLAIGSPRLADQPLASREVPAGSDQELVELVTRVETHLGTHPDDGKGWEVLGPVYMRLGRYDDAARAFDNASRLLGASGDRQALLGEAITQAHGGVVTEDARDDFEVAAKLDPGNVRARFYLAVALGQSGRKDEAVAAWNRLIAGAPADAPWLPSAKAQLARLDGAAPGPSASDVAAAAAKTPADRQAMIEGMVSGLAERLNAAPDDAEGWARLFRAYIVLGRAADAASAYGRARTALAGKPALLAAVDKAAADNGIAVANP